MSQPTRPPHRRSGRRIRRLVTSLVVVVGLLVAADFGLAAFAEHTIAQQTREQLGLRDDPSVTVHGFPFTTQAVSGEYDHITLSADGVSVENVLTDLSLAAELRDVSAPLSDLRGGNVENIDIGNLQGRATLKDSDINQVTPLDNIENLRIEPASEEYVRHGEAGSDTSGDTGDSGDSAGSQQGAGSEQSTTGVRLSGRLQIAGMDMEIFAFAMISLDGTTIRITPHRLQFGNDQETTTVPPAVQQQLLPNFEADINAGDLPFTVTPTAVTVDSGSITLEGTASNVTLAGAGDGR